MLTLSKIQTSTVKAAVFNISSVPNASYRIYRDPTRV